MESKKVHLGVWFSFGGGSFIKLEMYLGGLCAIFFRGSCAL